MAQILMSIHPEYAHRIISGEKKFEYRRSRCKMDIDRIIIYATYPEKVILGEAEVKKIISSTPEDIWQKTKEASGISKKDYFSYFRYTSVAYAYCLGEITVYSIPKPLSEFGITKSPQSFIYIEKSSGD